MLKFVANTVMPVIPNRGNLKAHFEDSIPPNFSTL